MNNGTYRQTDKLQTITLQTHHVYSMLKGRGNGRFHIVSTWNTRGVFVGLAQRKLRIEISLEE